MAYKAPKFVHAYKDRHGKPRVYYSRTGHPKIALRGPVGSEEFWIDYHKAEKGLAQTKPEIGADRILPGSFDDVITRYYKSPRYLGLAPATQANTRRILDNFRQEKDRGQRPIKGFERQHMDAILGKMADRPGAANNLLKRVKVITRFAVDMNIIKTDPLIGMRKLKYKTKSIPTWGQGDIAKFTERHPHGTKAHLAMTIMRCTGQRLSDAVRMGWQHVKEGRIEVCQQKTGTFVTIPLHPDLKAAIEPLSREAETFLLTEYGKPFAAAGFGNWMRDRCDEAGLPDLSSHGLRSAMATALAEAGCSAKELMSITGHKSLAEAEVYIRAAEQKLLSANAMKALSKAEKGTKSANPNPKVSKSAA